MSDFGPIARLRHRAASRVPVAPARLTAGPGVLSLGFDDFPASAWTEGGRVLADQGVRATYYACGGFCGATHLGLPQFEVAHLEALVAAGHELGCHTYAHRSVLALSSAELAADLDSNAAWVAERLEGRRMASFAFPFGHVSVGAKRAVGRRFRTGRGVRDGVNLGVVDRAALLAIGLESRRLPDYDLDAMAAATAERGGWLVAYGHDVGDRPSPYGCTPRDLERLIVAARAAGLDIRPAGEAAARLASRV